MSHFRWIIGTLLAFLLMALLLTSAIASWGSASFDEWRLVFQRSQSSLEFWGIALIAGGCVAAMTALFRYEQQLLPLRLGILLLSLRVTLVLIIFLTLLKPVWTWTYDQKKLQRLLIALDVSESMETVDRQASEVEKLGWADALQFLGSGAARERARSWIAAIQAGKEPEWVAPTEEADFQKRKQLTQVRKENLLSQLRELEGLSRLEIMRRLCMPQPASPFASLADLTELQFTAFGEKPVALSPDELKDAQKLTSLPVGRSHSNLGEAAIAAHLEAGSAPLAGVVLLSDGHDTDTPESSKLIAKLQQLGVPVHTVMIGSEHRPKDLSVIQVDHPESVFIKDQPLVKASLQTSGFVGETVRVFLDDLDHPEESPREKTITPSSTTAEVSFQLADLNVGRHRFRIRTEEAPGETRTDNNSSEFSIQVVDDRARVLLVDGESRWEFRFLDAALRRDEQITVDNVLFEQPYLRVLKHPFFPTSLDELGPVKEDSTPFAPYDLVVIGDVSPQRLNAQRWQQLDRYVREEGGTLILTAGKRFFPMAYQGTLAESLLPVQNLREIRLDDVSQIGPPAMRGFRVSFTPDGEAMPIFQLDADPATSQKIWKTLPGHQWGIVGVARGGANVWAVPLRPDEANSLEQERQNGLIVQHYVGSGQVVWIGLDSTWRWRYLVGDLYHHRFWGQLIRWAVSFKAAAGNDTVRLGLRESVIQVGQPAVIQARWNHGFLNQNPQLKAEAVIQSRSDSKLPPQTIELTANSGNKLIYEGQALNLPGGEYVVSLKVSGSNETPELPEISLIVNEALSAELQDVSSNRPLLQQIASATGGVFLKPNELDRLPSLFQNMTISDRIREEIPLYSHWSILLLFSAVAMTEWVLRKLNGLP